jgi:hypothetical protein
MQFKYKSILDETEIAFSQRFSTTCPQAISAASSDADNFTTAALGTTHSTESTIRPVRRKATMYAALAHMGYGPS